MIIELNGPPGVGKSTFAAKYTLNHPEVTYCSIDQCREFYQDEMNAWNYLEQIIFTSQNDILLESSGLNWRLRLIEAKLQEEKYKVHKICMYGSEKLILERLSKRQKKQGIKLYHIDEKEFLRYVFDNLGYLLSEADIKIDITEMNELQVYQELTNKLVQIRSQNA